MRPLLRDATNLRLLYAGRLTPDKGVHTVVEALGQLLQTQPDLSLTLTIIGDGPPKYESMLRKLAESFHVADVIHFKKQVQRGLMPEILAEHDVLLFPSIWAEPLARMPQEAMASGLLVIGTSTGGTPELLDDGYNGLIFEAGNAQMLADKILQVAANPDLKLKLIRAARKTIEEKFNFERMVDEIEDNLLKVLRQKSHLSKNVIFP